MYNKLVSLLLILCPIGIYGQFGVNVKYLFGQSETLNEVNLSQDGFQASLEYSFRLKENRIEFHPGLGYRYTFKDDKYDGNFTGIDLDFNTAIYPFDFEGDCDCPTWSKDGTLIKKGFFIEVSPGISYQTLHREKFNTLADPQPTPLSTTEVIYKLGGALGLDIGLSEQLTLTPMVSYTRVTNKEWDGLLRDGSPGLLDDQSYFGTGIRLTYKPDPKRRRRF